MKVGCPYMLELDFSGFSIRLFLVGGGSGGRGRLTCRRTNHHEVIHSYEQIFLFSHFQLECLIYC